MRVIYENELFAVEEHPQAPKPYWIIDKRENNPMHAVDHFYDTERAIEWADRYLGEEKTEALAKIAEENIPCLNGRCDLKRRYNGSEDFFEIAVWELRDALAAAYCRGYEAAKRGQ